MSDTSHVRPVGTYGPVGASTTIYSQKWVCTDCKYTNFAAAASCKRCKKAAPANAENNNDSQTQQNALTHTWREVLDPQSQQMYYYNTETSETSWDRPECMGPAPYASGWFGRGVAGADTNKYDADNELFLSRPARKQKDKIEAKNTSVEGNMDYNIWYGKSRGENWNEADLGQDLAPNRCVIATDAGRTKADSKDSGQKFFCIQFCRGKCARGAECTWFHRIPTIADDGMASQMHDCFGRERHKTNKEDMSGAGSFEKPSRTLYVGRLRPDKWAGDKELHAALKKQFGEWGEVEHINLISRKNIAFVRYRFRSGAEFGKEAMCNQTLGQGEIINVRWAHDDPNPIAQEAIRRADADAAVAALKARGVQIKRAADESSEEVITGVTSDYPNTSEEKGEGEEEGEGEPAAKRAKTD
ncbi:hypothetical protein TrVE_jg5255 [Triparma verrucosa]|uniref:Pre-mRNA-splicing factor cwc2 n=1 Tax=Triparma verrucosa TaxID=1606542 RepID=A0A9W7BDG6_9STRA|nr:hypothetical protein TrVE_jg5255 [Triparma verrucosa]